jgi:hypothetical protein
MYDSIARLRHVTRRHFFSDCRLGLGALGLAALLDRRLLAADPDDAARRINPLAVRPTHFPAKATNVIYLFMAGGPSQLELFNYRPKLQELNGQVIPESFVAGKRFAFLKRDARLLGTKRQFARHGECGTELSACLPHLAKIVDDVAVIKSRPAEHGGVVDVRHRQRGQRAAGVRGAAVRPARPARGSAAVGQRLPADRLPGSAVPERRGADPEPHESAGH